MNEPRGLQTFVFTEEFLKDWLTGRFTASENDWILRALRLLDTNERHPSLRVHLMKGDLQGQWSASASDELRITFRRLEGGRKELLSVSRHYRR